MDQTIDAVDRRRMTQSASRKSRDEPGKTHTKVTKVTKLRGMAKEFKNGFFSDVLRWVRASGHLSSFLRDPGDLSVILSAAWPRAIESPYTLKI
jgi:hypothetical protein